MARVTTRTSRHAALTSSPMSAAAASYALLPGPGHLVMPFKVLVIMLSSLSPAQTVDFLSVLNLSKVNLSVTKIDLKVVSAPLAQPARFAYCPAARYAHGLFSGVPLSLLFSYSRTIEGSPNHAHHAARGHAGRQRAQDQAWTKLTPVIEDATLLDKYVIQFVASCVDNVAIEETCPRASQSKILIRRKGWA